MSVDELPVVVIGGGPVGLAAASDLLERGLHPLVKEAGSRPGASVAEGAHVPMFSPWSYNVDQAAARILERAGDADRRVELARPDTGACTTDLGGSDTAATAGCCGGPVPAGPQACCRADAEAKRAGLEGCGCGASSTPPSTPHARAEQA